MSLLPIHKIVCPTDFSDPSYEGVKVAAELAEKLESELILVNVISPVPVMSGSAAPTGFHIPSVMNEMRSWAEKAISILITEKISKTVQSRSIVIQGNPAEEIVRLADKENADMIIIATHGESGWKRFLFGSVTEKVIRMTSCPVLTVQQPKQTASPD
jgi:nucleotide-binding universal stress UspA family protein